MNNIADKLHIAAPLLHTNLHTVLITRAVLGFTHQITHKKKEKK